MGIQNFQTIQSILNDLPGDFKVLKEKVFPNYSVYFKPIQTIIMRNEFEQFPNYSVYFKLCNRIGVVYCLSLFPNYSVYFKHKVMGGEAKSEHKFPNYSVYFKPYYSVDNIHIGCCISKLFSLF